MIVNGLDMESLKIDLLCFPILQLLAVCSYTIILLHIQ